MRTGYIYALIDPRDGAVRYVGQTTKDTETRRTQHIARPSNKQTAAWIAELRECGVEPNIITIECVPINDINAREAFWIKEFSSLYSLLNAWAPSRHVRMARSKGKQVHLHIPPRLNAWLDETAAREDMTFGQLAVEAVRNFLRDQE